MFEIPGYRIERELGRGGMATVYLATQLSLSRHVALKVLAPALANDPVATERFLREAQIAAKLHHPHIVEIHDVGVVDGNPFMAMAYQSLSDAEFAEYIAFSQTPAGKKLNAALFQAFEAVYKDVSKNLGLAVARQLQGEDI